MVIRTDDPELAEDLYTHFRRSGFQAERAGECAIEVARVDAPNPDQGRREVLVHLHVWKVIHPR
jgi:hypothetical protein